MSKVDNQSKIERIGVTEVQLIFQKLDFIFREQTKDDYGIDAEIELTEGGLACGRLIALQIKSGKSFLKEQTDNCIVFRGEQKHLLYWQLHSLPVMLIIYDLESKIAYWQIINKYTVEVTGKNWKTRIPLTQKIDESSVILIRQYATKIVTLNDYTVTELQDTRHGGAKRYIAKILLNKEFSRPEMITLARKITEEVKLENYYRNDLLKQRFVQTPAHVVWLYFALSLEDIKRCNWICITQWIDKNLAPEFTPSKISGEIFDDGIIIEWNESYEATCNFFNTYRISKQLFLEKLQEVLSPTREIVARMVVLSENSKTNQLSEADYINKMSQLERELTVLYDLARNVGLAPVECRDLSQKFQNVMALAHNIVLPFSERGLKTWGKSNRDYLVFSAIENYQKEIQRFEFEFEKVHG